VYGACFSPDNSKLYTTALNRLYQYDLSSDDPATMVASKTLIYQALDNLWALQLGPDEVIYVARNSVRYLGMVTQPDLPGTACGYVHDGFNLAGKFSQLGLPNRVVVSRSGVTGTNLLISGDTTICAGQSVPLSASGSLNYYWSPADGLSCT